MFINKLLLLIQVRSSSITNWLLKLLNYIFIFNIFLLSPANTIDFCIFFLKSRKKIIFLRFSNCRHLQFQFVYEHCQIFFTRSFRSGNFDFSIFFNSIWPTSILIRKTWTMAILSGWFVGRVYLQTTYYHYYFWLG